MKAETLLAAVDGLISLRGDFQQSGGFEVTTSYLASRILLNTGADVSASSVKAALEVLGATAGSGGRYIDDEIHEAITGAHFAAVRKRLLVLTGRETGEGVGSG